MNERLNLNDLVDILSTEKNISKKEADVFLRELFTLIIEKISQKKTVKIKDFGTFKVITVKARKSVDVNTKEAIEIPSHYKLTFTPDKNLKDSVNKPFAHFESVLLNEGVDFPDLKENSSSMKKKSDNELIDKAEAELDEKESKKKSSNLLISGLAGLASFFRSKKKEKDNLDTQQTQTVEADDISAKLEDGSISTDKEEMKGDEFPIILETENTGEATPKDSDAPNSEEEEQSGQEENTTPEQDEASKPIDNVEGEDDEKGVAFPIILETENSDEATAEDSDAPNTEEEEQSGQDENTTPEQDEASTPIDNDGGKEDEKDVAFPIILGTENSDEATAEDSDAPNTEEEEQSGQDENTQPEQDEASTPIDNDGGKEHEKDVAFPIILETENTGEATPEDSDTPITEEGNTYENEIAALNISNEANDLESEEPVNFEDSKIGNAISEAVEAIENFSNTEAARKVEDKENFKRNKTENNMDKDYENWQEDEEKKRFEEWKRQQRELMQDDESIETDEEMAEMISEQKNKRRGVFLYLLAFLFLVLLILILIFSSRNRQNAPNVYESERAENANVPNSNNEGNTEVMGLGTVTNQEEPGNIQNDENTQTNEIVDSEQPLGSEAGINTPVESNPSNPDNAVNNDNSAQQGNESQDIALPTKVTLTRGETLRLLSEKYYGNRSFWVYIFEENKNIIHNPNGIQVGMDLTIPSKAKYGIDADSQASLSKARQLENELFRMYNRY